MKKAAKKTLVAIVGGAVTLIGIALIVLPGPAFLVIPAGLAILATEFEFARRWMNHLKHRIEAFQSARRKKKEAAARRKACIS